MAGLRTKLPSVYASRTFSICGRKFKGVF